MTKKKEVEIEENVERIPQTSVAQYRPVYELIDKAEKENSALTFAYDTPTGNKEARSHVHKLRGVRGALEAARKEAKASVLAIGKAIDSEAATLEERIVGMIKVHTDPLEAIEKKEQERKERLRRMAQSFAYVPGMDSAGLKLEIQRLHLDIIGEEYEEFQAEAIATRNQSLQRYQDELVLVERREAEAAELAKLRAEAAERAKADEAARIAAAAVEQERQRQADAQAALDRREREAILAQERAAAAIAEAKQREADLQAQHAIEKAQAAERAAESERLRQEAVNAAVRAENERREKDVAHRRKINREAVASGVALGWSEEAAKGIVEAIAKGKIANVSVNY